MIGDTASAPGHAEFKAPFSKSQLRDLGQDFVVLSETENAFIDC